MAFRFVYWLIALLISLIFAVHEQESLFTQMYGYQSPSPFSEPIGTEPATYGIVFHEPDSSSREYTIDNITVSEAKRLMNVCSFGAIALLAAIHLLIFYVIWLIAFKKKRLKN